MDIKLLTIRSTELSNRAKNALTGAGINTVGDLIKLNEESLLNIRNLGRKTLDEILQSIERFKENNEDGLMRSDGLESTRIEIPADYDTLIQEEAGREYVISWLKENNIRIDALELLSARAYNLLMFGGVKDLGQIVFMKADDLMTFPRMDTASAEEVVRLCSHYLHDKQDEILAAYANTVNNERIVPMVTILDMLKMPEYHDVILNYVKMNERSIRKLGLSNRPVNRLTMNGYENISEIIFLSDNDLLAIPSMGTGSVKEIRSVINEYLKENESRMIAVCTGDETSLLDDNAIRDMIRALYQKAGFGGFSLKEIIEHLHLPDGITEARIKSSIGSLLADNVLEYVDFRCYRVYGRFADYLKSCTDIGDRSKELILKRLQGATLEEIGQEYGLTRERVRQIIKKDVQKVANWYEIRTGMAYFDEDYYRYFYGTYSFEKKDAVKWFGMTEETCNYLDMVDVKRGKADLHAALEDTQNLEAGLRLKVKNYLNRNKLYIDDVWIEKRRVELEELVARKFCREETSFDDFVNIYNTFLQEEDIAYDEDLYLTEAVLRTRLNKMADSRYLLWKQNRRIRYYDIDGRDYTDLIDGLGLDAYENIELSTLKFVEDYPEILEKYDLHDQYELHNLLRKTIPDGSYHDFHCERTPMIRFGTFDRDAAILEIMMDNAPISQSELCELVHQEYGYDLPTIQGTYLGSISEYYYQGMYSVDQKVMSPEHKELLKSELTDDFYYIDEVKRIYKRLVPDADNEEVNPYNLKLMGLNVLSRYVLQNYASLEAYMTHLLTEEDIIDITSYRKRFAYVQMFSAKLMELKRELEIIEFEPNRIINIRRLEDSGVSKDMLRDFCDEVYEFVPENSYFSAASLRQDGFASVLYDLGFSDWFYANLLLSDDRFSQGRMFGSIILYKGREDITIKSFLKDRIREHGSIDTYDLVTELEERYGCQISDRLDLIYKVRGTEIYHDSILDRFYANVDAYYRELDETDGN